MDCSDTVIEGWAKKLSRYRIWQRRWFVLSRDAIGYARSPESAKKDGVPMHWSLSAVQKVQDKGVSKGEKLVVRFKGLKIPKLQFKPDDPEGWYRALNETCKKYQTALKEVTSAASASSSLTGTRVSTLAEIESPGDLRAGGDASSRQFMAKRTLLPARPAHKRATIAVRVNESLQEIIRGDLRDVQTGVTGARPHFVTGDAQVKICFSRAPDSKRRDSGAGGGWDAATALEGTYSFAVDSILPGITSGVARVPLRSIHGDAADAKHGDSSGDECAEKPWLCELAWWRVCSDATSGAEMATVRRDATLGQLTTPRDATQAEDLVSHSLHWRNVTFGRGSYRALPGFIWTLLHAALHEHGSAFNWVALCGSLGAAIFAAGFFDFTPQALWVALVLLLAFLWFLSASAEENIGRVARGEAVARTGLSNRLLIVQVQRVRQRVAPEWDEVGGDSPLESNSTDRDRLLEEEKPPGQWMHTPQRPLWPAKDLRVDTGPSNARGSSIRTNPIVESGGDVSGIRDAQ